MPAPLGLGGHEPRFPEFYQLMVHTGLRESADISQRLRVPSLQGLTEQGLAYQAVQRPLLIIYAHSLGLSSH